MTSSPRTEAEAKEHNRSHRIVVYVAFVLWTVFLLWRMDAYYDDAIAKVEAEAEARSVEIDRESKSRAFVLCTRGNEARQNIREFVEALTEGRTSPGAIAAREQAAEDFAALPCPPEPTGGE